MKNCSYLSCSSMGSLVWATSLQFFSYIIVCFCFIHLSILQNFSPVSVTHLSYVFLYFIFHTNLGHPFIIFPKRLPPSFLVPSWIHCLLSFYICVQTTDVDRQYIIHLWSKLFYSCLFWYSIVFSFRICYTTFLYIVLLSFSLISTGIIISFVFGKHPAAYTTTDHAAFWYILGLIFYLFPCFTYTSCVFYSPVPAWNFCSFYNRFWFWLFILHPKNLQFCKVSHITRKHS